MSRLDGKVALITGAARGIGREAAEAMAAAGAKIVAGDVLEDVLSSTVAALKSRYADVVACRLDVTRPQDWTDAVSLATTQFGRLDILVNNAGIFIGKDFEDVTLEEWHQLVAVNMTGVFLGTKICAPALRDAAKTSPHGSSIVNLASVAGLVGSVADQLYSMTKGGVTLFTKSTALSFGKKGHRIRVNSVHPGVIDTEMGNRALSRRMHANASNDATEFAKMLHPIGRLGTADDVAGAIVFLASDDAKFITGAGLTVDGGFTAQ